MRSLALFWYYFFILLVVISALMLGDFSGINTSSRLLLGLFLVLLILNPLAFIWSVKRGFHTLLYGSSEAERANRLQAENEKLKAADRVKTEYLARTTHQLRTPLSAIKWTCHMIMNGDLGPVSSDQKMFMQRAYESIERVITIVNDWLSLDYTEANRGKYQAVPVDINEVIDGVVFEFNQRVKERAQELVVNRVPAEAATLLLDPIKFSMALENLLDNAIKYTPANGRISITINNDRLKADRPELALAVSDTGIGIPTAEQSKMFNQFARASNAVSLAPRGSGLGLYIVKEIVSAQGGKVWFESEEGKGTTFHLTIPLATAPGV